jgi:glucose/arabinose dehydrogenase
MHRTWPWLGALPGLLLAGCLGGSDPSYRISTQVAEGGTLSPAVTTVAAGSTVALEAQAAPGFELASVTGCGGRLQGSTYTTGPVDADCTVVAAFRLRRYAVAAVASPAGAVSPQASQVEHGSRLTVTLTPGPGSVLVGVSGCGGTLAGLAYTSAPLTADCTITATFAQPLTLLQGLSAPWGLAELPDGRLLVTERTGTLAVIDASRTAVVSRLALPLDLAVEGQGGLLDVALDPAFEQDPWVYVSYTERGSGSEAGLFGTAVARARLAGSTLSGWQVIARQTPKVGGGAHFGSRLVFRPDKTLFVTFGDRGASALAQDPRSTVGKVIRLNRDGSLPADAANLPGALPEIWSLGHRNVQGAAIRPGTGELWANEHGPQGGDEFNRVLPGGNYGWPLVSYGCNYGDPVGEACRIGGGAHGPTWVEPVSYWVPTSVAPAGLVFYTGSRFAAWQGHAFMGALAGAALWRIVLDGNAEASRERLFASLGERIRDVRQGRDGYLYLLTDSGKLVQVRD